MLPYDSVGAPLVGVLRDLNVQEDKIQAVIQALTTVETDLSENSFSRNARIPVGAFGGSPVGHDLGTHHNRAQQVFDDTIKGVTEDLKRFRDGVQQARRLVTTADETSADDLTRKRQVVDQLQSVWQNSEGDRANRWGRNHPGDHDYPEGDD